MTSNREKPEENEVEVVDSLQATDTRAESMFKAYLSGMTVSELARLYSTSESSVYRLAAKWNWKNHKKQLDKRAYKKIMKGVAAELDAERALEKALEENQIKQHADGRYYSEIEIITKSRYPFGIIPPDPRCERITVDGRYYIRTFLTDAELTTLKSQAKSK